MAALSRSVERMKMNNLNCPKCDGHAEIVEDTIVCLSGCRTVVTKQMQDDLRAALVNAAAYKPERR